MWCSICVVRFIDISQKLQYPPDFWSEKKTNCSNNNKMNKMWIRIVCSASTEYNQKCLNSSELKECIKIVRAGKKSWQELVNNRQRKQTCRTLIHRSLLEEHYWSLQCMKACIYVTFNGSLYRTLSSNELTHAVCFCHLSHFVFVPCTRCCCTRSFGRR